MSNDEQPGKTLKDYIPTESPRPEDTSFTQSLPARPYENTTGEASGGVFDQRGSRSRDQSETSSVGSVGPFTVYLFDVPGGFEVSVGWGHVVETIPGAENALAFLEPLNRLDGSDLARFVITLENPAVYVAVEVDKNGKITSPLPEDPEGDPTPAVRIEVGEDNRASVHYIPIVDNLTPGAAGTMYYKLAVLKAPITPSTTPTLEKWLAGSHIYHYQELPSIRSTFGAGDGVGVITKEWNNAGGFYEMRVVSKGTGRNNVSTSGDEVIVRGTKLNADVFVWEGDGPRPSARQFGWEDGYLMTGNVVEVNDDEAPPEPQPIDIKIPEVVARPAEAQIKVTQVGLDGGIKYQVEGNSKKRTIKYLIDGESEAVTVATFDDGMETSGTEAGNEIVIPIPAGGASEETHPWKVKPATTAGRVVVAKGFIFFPTATGESGPDGDLVMNPIEYGPHPCNDNGEIIVSGEGYIWAVVTESSYNLVSNFGTIGENGILHLRVRNSAGINAVFSAAAPSSSDTAIVYKVAKVNLVGGLAVVTEQYLTHNPTHDLAHFGNPS